MRRGLHLAASSLAAASSTAREGCLGAVSSASFGSVSGLGGHSNQAVRSSPYCHPYSSAAVQQASAAEMAAASRFATTVGSWASTVRGKSDPPALDSGLLQAPPPSLRNRRTHHSSQGHCRRVPDSIGQGSPSRASPWAAAVSAAADIAVAPEPAKLQSRRSSSRASVAPAEQALLGEGGLVGFSKRNAQGLAVIQEKQGGFWRAIDQRGGEVWLHPSDIVLKLPGGGYSTADCEKVYTAAASGNLPAPGPIWQEISKDGRLLYVEDLAVFVFGDSSATSQWSAFRFVTRNRAFFKQVGRKPPCFQPRPSACVEEMQREQEAASLQRARLSSWADEFQRCARLSAAEKPEKEGLLKGPHRDFLLALEAYAKTQETPEERELAVQALAAIGCFAHPDTAAEALRHMGCLPQYLSVALLRATVPKAFEQELLDDATRRSSSPPPDLDADLRQDFRHHKVITIDDEFTTEIDDGLSVEWLEDGRQRLWVHIADPTRWLELGDSLDTEASSRVTTLYLPTGKIPMFPEVVAEGCFSLRQDHETCAMSVGVVLADDGSLSDIVVTPSVVKPAYRLTYLDTDELLRVVTAEEEPELVALHEAARRRNAFRTGNGAVSIDMPECKVRVEFPDGPHGVPDVKAEREFIDDSPSSALVMEMMVMAGEAVAQFCGERSIPVPFRCQANPVVPTEDEMIDLPIGPCRSIALRRRMTRSITSTGSPGRHAGLGLDGYVQFTSPIRRYGDLIAHWQVKAFLRGEACPYTPKEVSEVMNRVASHQQDVNKTDREVRNYWLAVYFQQRMHTTWDVLFLAWARQETGAAQLLIESLGLELMQTLDRAAVPGDMLRMTCTEVDLNKGTFRLEVVQ